MKLNNAVATKRDFPDTKALDLARAKAAEPGGTTVSVLQALFELLIGEKDPTAARTAQVVSSERYGRYVARQLVPFIFQDSPINDDAIPFVLDLSQSGYTFPYTLGITLALIAQLNRRLLGHPDLYHILEITRPDFTPLEIGKRLLKLGSSFSYAGPFRTSLVAEVVVAALAVTDDTAKTPQDIVQIISQLSQ